MLENILNRLYELTYNRVRALFSRAIVEGAEHGARDAMRKLGILDEAEPANGNSQASVVVIDAKPDGQPKMPRQDPTQSSPALPPRRRGRPRKAINYDNPNKP